MVENVLYVCAFILCVAVIIRLWVDSRKMKILVWNKYQKISARVYGDAHFGKGKYIIFVCKDPNVQLAKYGEKRAMIYHFS